MKRLGAVDLTNGKVMLSILRFSWPIFVGNAFQQLYNVVDTAVLGRYADYCAMASVGLCFPIIVSVIALFCGIGTGTSVIVSRYRGAGENNSIKETILSAWGIVLVGSIPLALLGVWNAEALLQLAGVHEALIGDAASYLRIYFSASIAVLGLNEARFSNIFIEKRASTCPQSLEKSRLFSYALLVSECENFQNMKRIFLRKVVI